jgi:phage/plasmid-like protein (TIGR03299 family)
MTAGVRQMAYVGETPWHGLGNVMKPNMTREQWTRAADMGWEVVRVPSYYEYGGKRYPTEIRDNLIRSDEPQTVLGVVGVDYKPVQPKQVMDFFFDSTEKTDFEMETAGTLQEGRRLWGLARMKDGDIVLGKKDRIKPYLLLATSTDGYSATFAAFTTVRVVCCNTLEAARRDIGKPDANHVRVSHSVAFDPKAVRKMLSGAEKTYEAFRKDAMTLAKRKVSNQEAKAYFIDLLGKKDSEKLDINDASTFGKKMNKMLELFKNGPGAELDTSRDTAWGLVNAVTRYADFEAKAESSGNRLTAAWFGAGAKLKETAMLKAMAMAA